MSEQLRIVIAEDHPFFRKGLRTALENAASLEVVAEASDGLTALEQVRSLAPDLVVLDVGLPRMNGIALVRRMREEQISAEVVFLTICDDEGVFEEALALGVKGYLLKDCTEAEFLGCVTAVSSGHHYTSPSMTSYLVNKTRRVSGLTRNNPGLGLLTPQEREILRRIAVEKTSKEIAREMGIAPKTVDAHRSNICNKLEIHGHHVLTRFAVRHRSEI